MTTDTTPLWLIVLGSAGIGALVSSASSILAQVIEQRTRRKELLLTKAIELAIMHSQAARDSSAKSGMPIRVQDEAVSAETYYQWLEHLLATGRLPDDPRIERLRPDAGPVRS